MSVDGLVELYLSDGKHSSYQILAKTVSDMIGLDQGSNVEGKFELERFKFINDKVCFDDKSVLDIGSNTGYFTFTSLENGAREVFCYEGNRKHADFVKRASNGLGLESIYVNNEYYMFDGAGPHVDVGLLLNVVHHFGDDFGDVDVNIVNAKDKMIECINSLAPKCNILVLQLGFNWKGDRKFPLFEGGTKKEMIDFIEKRTKGVFEVVTCGVAQSRDDGIVYEELCADNLPRNDSLGEFLNRPIFILKSLS